jgi:ADP-heptose:LPS heptosyltransferase
VDAYAGKALAFRAGLADRYAGLVCFNYQGSCARRTLCRADAEALLWQLADRYPDHAIVVIHPLGDRARAAELVAASARQNVMLSSATAHVLELAALVRECELVVSPDTAVIHIASVYNKKVLGFYVNSGNHRWFYRCATTSACCCRRPTASAASTARRAQRHRRADGRLSLIRTAS